MPHFVIDCAKDVLTTSTHSSLKVIQEIYLVAEKTALFDKKDIKVRIQSFEEYNVGGDKTAFIHVFANIMEGRSTTQKANLSKQIVGKLTEMFPDVPFIAMNVREFEKATYFNRSML